MLARHDGRFVNRHYLALPLLELVLADAPSGLDPDRLAALLMADVIRHELQHRRRIPTPPPRTCCGGGSGTRAGSSRTASAFPSRPARSPGCPRLPATRAADWIELTVPRVSTRHDEYFFLRALQCHELTFTVLTADVRAAVEALRAGAAERAAERIEHAVTVFERAALLFRVVATMDAGAFADFRHHTDGASADAVGPVQAVRGGLRPARRPPAGLARVRRRPDGAGRGAGRSRRPVPRVPRRPAGRAGGRPPGRGD